MAKIDVEKARDILNHINDMQKAVDDNKDFKKEDVPERLPSDFYDLLRETFDEDAIKGFVEDARKDDSFLNGLENSIRTATGIEADADPTIKEGTNDADTTNDSQDESTQNKEETQNKKESTSKSSGQETEQGAEPQSPYEYARDKYESTKDKYFRNTYTLALKLEYNIEAYRAGEIGPRGTLVGGGDIAINVVEILRSNLWDALIEMALVEFFDALFPPSAQVAVEQFAEGAVTNEQAASSTVVDNQIYDVSRTIRDDGYIEKGAKLSDLGITDKNPLVGNYMGVDMTREPYISKDGETKIWRVGHGDVLVTAIDGKSTEARLEPMRLIERQGNKYLVSPCGNIEWANITNEKTALGKVEEVNGIRYIDPIGSYQKEWDSTLIRNGRDYVVKPELEAYAAGRGASVDDYRATIDDKARETYVNRVAGEISKHQDYLIETALPTTKGQVEWYKEKYAQLDAKERECKAELAEIEVKATPREDGTVAYSEKDAEREKELKTTLDDIASDKENLTPAIEKADKRATKIENTLNHYENAIDVISSRTTDLTEKFSAALQAGSGAAGRTSREDFGMTTKDFKNDVADLSKYEVEQYSDKDIEDMQKTYDNIRENPDAFSEFDEDFEGSAEAEQIANEESSMSAVEEKQVEISVDKQLTPENYKEKLDDICGRFAQVDEEISKAKIALEDKKTDLDNQLEATKAMQERIDTTKDKVEKESLSGTIVDMEKYANKLEADIKGLENKISSLEEEHNAMDRFVEADDKNDFETSKEIYNDFLKLEANSPIQVSKEENHENKDIENKNNDTDNTPKDTDKDDHHNDNPPTDVDGQGDGQNDISNEDETTPDVDSGNESAVAEMPPNEEVGKGFDDGLVTNDVKQELKNIAIENVATPENPNVLQQDVEQTGTEGKIASEQDDGDIAVLEDEEAQYQKDDMRNAIAEGIDAYLEKDPAATYSFKEDCLDEIAQKEKEEGCAFDKEDVVEAVKDKIEQIIKDTPDLENDEEKVSQVKDICQDIGDFLFSGTSERLDRLLDAFDGNNPIEAMKETLNFLSNGQVDQFEHYIDRAESIIERISDSIHANLKGEAITTGAEGVENVTGQDVDYQTALDNTVAKLEDLASTEVDSTIELLPKEISALNGTIDGYEGMINSTIEAVTNVGMESAVDLGMDTGEVAETMIENHNIAEAVANDAAAETAMETGAEDAIEELVNGATSAAAETAGEVEIVDILL